MTSERIVGFSRAEGPNNATEGLQSWGGHYEGDFG
jgi:hypothetical protein